MQHRLNRREVVTLLGGAAAWPIAARAQQPPMPVIGFLELRSPDVVVDRMRAFRQSLKDTGYVEGANATIEYRWAENHRFCFNDLMLNRGGVQVGRRFTLLPPALDLTMTSHMPPVPPGERSNKGRTAGETPKSTKQAVKHEHHPQGAEKGQTANIEQNTTDKGFFHGRRFDK